MDNCPGCKVSWIGDPIPESMLNAYAGTHWQRQIGIDGGYIGVYDGTVAYQCPDCKEEFPVGNSNWAQDVFSKYKKAIKE